MESLTQRLMKQLSGDGLAELSGMIGADESTTGSLLSAAGPLLTSALAKNAATPDARKPIRRSPSQSSATAAGVRRGRRVWPCSHTCVCRPPPTGARQRRLAGGSSRSAWSCSGCAASVRRGVQIVAPLLMGLLGRQQRSQGLDAGGLSAFLGGEREAEEQASPDIMKMATGLLDTDKDGSPGEDILGMVGKLFGGR